MQSTPPVVSSATVSVDEYSSLFVAFQSVPDPRRSASVIYPLAALLALAVAAILANHTSVLAIAEWGKRQSAEVLADLGLPDGRAPWQSTLQRVFAQLDGHVLAAVLTAHFAPLAASDPARTEPSGIAIDGKAQRGRLVFDSTGGTVHALSALCHDTGIVLAHEPLTTTGPKSEAELTVTPVLIDRLDWHQRVLTGDALYCQRRVTQHVVAAGGDYLVLVRGNQPALQDAIQRLFDPAPGDHPLPLRDQRVAQTMDRGHGRGREVRQLIATTDLTAYLAQEFDWPGIAQVFRLERTWSDHGEAKQQIRYGITSLNPDRGTPERLLALKRGHWQIENGLHRVKDVTFGEDQSLIHCGQGPTVMALLRDAALNLLHHHGIHRVTACLRSFSQFPDRAVALVLQAAYAHA